MLQTSVAHVNNVSALLSSLEQPELASMVFRLAESCRPAELSPSSDALFAQLPPSAAKSKSSQLARVMSVPCLRRDSGILLSPAKSITRLALSVEEEDRGAAEIKSIMQHGHGPETPPTTFLGVSPPRRSAGAANPLVQDWNWRSNVYVSSHNNLQALREIDSRGTSFLQPGSNSAEARFLVESFDSGVPGDSDCSVRSVFRQPKQETCQKEGITRVMAKPLTCQIGFKVA